MFLKLNRNCEETNTFTEALIETSAIESALYVKSKDLTAVNLRNGSCVWVVESPFYIAELTERLEEIAQYG